MRFWVEVVPQSETDINVYWEPKKMIEKIQINHSGKEVIKICPLRVKRSLFDFIKPITLGSFLENEFKLSPEAVKGKLSYLGLKPDIRIKDLGAAHQKMFAIISEFQKSSIVSFDYYGLAHDSEEQLTAYVKSELEEGKSAISFDNLYYKSNTPDFERIQNVDIKRK